MDVGKRGGRKGEVIVIVWCIAERHGNRLALHLAIFMAGIMV